MKNFFGYFESKLDFKNINIQNNVSLIFESWKEQLSAFVDIWKIELFSVEGNSITLGKISFGIILLILGFSASKILTSIIDRKFLSRLQIDTSTRYTLKTLTYYVSLILVVLFVLRTLHVPLTIFTFVGGALAIGVGFGSQNIVNNFISGLILMVERPIRIGDFIETDGIKGTVQGIGARSTIIKTVDNTHFVVPNSSFLEKNLLNWTLSDSIVRSLVKVGVAYGSDVQKVSSILFNLVKEHEDVLTFPEPEVLFADFADSSLNFELYFWVDLSKDVLTREVQSDLRFSINKAFIENKIEIPFPQRDIHIRTSVDKN